MPQDKPWYIVIAVTLLALAFGFAAFWLFAFTDGVDSGVAYAFLTPALLVIGFLTGQAVPGAVSSVLSRASVAAPPQEAPTPLSEPSTVAPPTDMGTVQSVAINTDPTRVTAAIRWDDGTVEERDYARGSVAEGQRVKR